MNQHGSLTSYVKLRVAHAPGIPGNVFPATDSVKTASHRPRYASRHVRDERAMMHIGIANSRKRGKYNQYSPRMRNSQFYVSGKRPIVSILCADTQTPGIE